MISFRISNPFAEQAECINDELSQKHQDSLNIIIRHGIESDTRGLRR